MTTGKPISLRTAAKALQAALTVGLMLFPTKPAKAQLTAAQIRQKADDALTPLWNSIRTRQAVYASNHNGRYWQGLRTHTACPADGTEVAPDALTSKPSDIDLNWTQTGLTMPSVLCFTIRVDAYDGPSGRGFTGTAEVTINGQVWERTANDGPETWRAHGWRRRDP